MASRGLPEDAFQKFSAKGSGGSLDPLASIGGIRGLAETILPGIVFTLIFTITHELPVALIASLAVGAAFTVARLVQRQSVVQALSGVVAIGISAFFAGRSGKAEDYFVPGLWTNAAYATAMIISIVAKWPFAGLLFGLLRGEGLEWRESPVRRRAYAAATWAIVGLLLLRLLVKTPLYFAGMVTELGIVNALLGAPAYLLVLWVAWLISRPREAAPDNL